jgi:tetratricopeptide (TPR) repeat protein
MEVFTVSARLVLGLYLVVDNLLPFLVSRSATGVAHGAHIGGFLAGLAAAWAMDRRALGARPREYARAPAAPGRADDIRAALAEGRMAEAAAAYFALPAGATRRLLGVRDALAFARWLHGHGHPEAALVVLRRQARDFPNDPDLAEAHVAAGEILLTDLGQPTPAYQHFLSALDLDPPEEVAALARRGVAAVEALQKRRIGRPHVRRV